MEFLPSPGVMAAFSIAVFILVITPGPDMTLFVGRALTQGRAAGLAAMSGAYTGIVVHTVFAAFGLSALLAASPKGFAMVKVAGAIYLVWLAVQAIRGGSALTLDKAERAPDPLYKSWLMGVAINLLNPKIVLFFVTFFPQFVSVSDPAASQKLGFLGVYFILFCLPFTTAMVFAAGWFSDMLRSSRRVSRALDYVFAGVFGTFAVKILLTRGG